MRKREKIDLPRGRAAPPGQPEGSRGDGCVLLGDATSADWRGPAKGGAGCIGGSPKSQPDCRRDQPGKSFFSSNVVKHLSPFKEQVASGILISVHPLLPVKAPQYVDGVRSREEHSICSRLGCVRSLSSWAAHVLKEAARPSAFTPGQTGFQGRGHAPMEAA